MYGNSVTCSISKHRLHIKCANLNKTKLKEINIKFWNCDSCDNFPFTDLTDYDLQSLSFHSQRTPGFHSSQSFNIFKDLPKLNMGYPTTQDFDQGNADTQQSLNFDYYKPRDFQELGSTLPNNCSFLHTNIRSLNKNIDALSSLISTHKLHFDFVGLSETWQNKKQTSYPEAMIGYQPMEFTPGQTQNSGCALFIRDTINHFKRDDLSCSFYSTSCEFQTIFVEVQNKNSRNMLVGVIYRHPSTNNVNEIEPFITQIKTILETCKKEKKETIIMGDFNLNLLKLETDNQVNLFLETMLTNFFHPHIIQPTRLTETNKYSLIDNIFYNNIDQECISGNLISHISDHLPNFFIINKSITHNNKAKKYKRDYSNFEIEDFCKSLTLCNLDEKLPTLNSTNDMYDVFHDSIAKLLDEFVPLKQVTQKEQKRLRKPWITNHILNLISTKNRACSYFIQTGCNDSLKMYRSLRNNINHEIRKSKYLYHKTYFESCKTNIKEFWNGVNRYLNKNHLGNSAPTIIKIGNSVFTEPKDIADQFNSYFTQVAPSLVKKLNLKCGSSRTHYDYLGQPLASSFFINATSPDEITDLISQLDAKKATDIYNFPVQIIKEIKHIIATPLKSNN